MWPRHAARGHEARAGRGQRAAVVTVKTGIDLTDRMERFSRPRLSALAGEHLSGYVLKKDSPSCGLDRVKVYAPHGGSPVRGAAACTRRRSSKRIHTCLSRRKVG